MAFMPKSDKNDGKYRRSSDGKAPRPSTDCKNGSRSGQVDQTNKRGLNKGIKGNTHCKQTLH